MMITTKICLLDSLSDVVFQSLTKDSKSCLQETLQKKLKWQSQPLQTIQYILYFGGIIMF